MTTPFLQAATTEGLALVEADLEGDDPRELVALAHEHEAEVLWVHANADLTPFGFEKRNGFARLHADRCPGGEPLPALPASEYAVVLAGAYHGLWGHKHVTADATPPPGCTVLELAANGTPVGLCRVFPAERLIDAPGVTAGHRTVANYVRLLLGGCAALGPGLADVESWGDSPEIIAAYCELGFEIAEQNAGWELVVTAPRRSDRRPT